MSTSCLNDILSEQHIEQLLTDPFQVLCDPMPDGNGNVPGPEPDSPTPVDPWASADYHAVALLTLKVPVTEIGEPQLILRSINDVLKPRVITSDWRVKWERKTAQTKRGNALKTTRSSQWRYLHHVGKPPATTPADRGVFFEPTPKRAKLTETE